jgi:sucrose-6-phosphate hydrolase SacC (GH32 family)
VTFNNVPKEDGRTILLGWANNWAYGQDIPTFPWKSAMTLPREIYLKKTSAGDRIIQLPSKEVIGLRGDSIDYTLLGSTIKEKAFEIEYEFNGGSATNFGLKLITGANEETVIGYDRNRKEVYFDRMKSGNVKFHPNFPSIERAPAELKNGKLKLHIFVDHSIVEIYINEGEQVITDQIFPNGDDYKVQEFSDGDAKTNIKTWTVNAVWNN